MRSLLLSSLVLVVNIHASQFSFLFYNDVFAGTDQHFTNGLALSYLGDTSFQDSSRTTKGIAISQMIMTPEDISQTVAQYDDLPYAGYLTLSGFIFQWDAKSFDEYRIELGVVGNESGARALQNFIHKILDNTPAQGWDTQLGTQVTLNALYRHGEITWKSSQNYLEMDWFNHYGIQIGNYISDVFAGSIFRIGKNYRKNFNVHYPSMKEEASLLLIEQNHGLGWSASIGINANLLAYSYIMDEAINQGYNFEKNNLNTNLYLGADFFYSRHKVSLFLQMLSPYTTSQTKPDKLGGFAYSYIF